MWLKPDVCAHLITDDLSDSVCYSCFAHARQSTDVNDSWFVVVTHHDSDDKVIDSFQTSYLTVP